MIYLYSCWFWGTFLSLIENQEVSSNRAWGLSQELSRLVVEIIPDNTSLFSHSLWGLVHFYPQSSPPGNEGATGKKKKTSFSSSFSLTSAVKTPRLVVHFTSCCLSERASGSWLRGQVKAALSPDEARVAFRSDSELKNMKTMHKLHLCHLLRGVASLLPTCVKRKWASEVKPELIQTDSDTLLLLINYIYIITD